jgi:type I restriction enzyme S subunit
MTTAEVHEPQSAKSIFGDSPDDWHVDRIKDHLDAIVGGEWGEDPDAHDEGVVIPVIRVADIRGLDVAVKDPTVRRIKESKLVGRLINQQTILLEKSGGGELTPVGRAVRVSMLQFAAICSNFMAKIDCNRAVDPSFLTYTFDALYSCCVNNASIQQTTGIQNLRVTDYLNTKVAFPHRTEQQRIASYLDASCTALDAVMCAKRQQLESLDALMLSLIHQAVTQGLNADVKKKPSKLDWLTLVPEHWQERQIKRLCSLVRGQFTHRPRNDPALYDGPYPFVQTGDITSAKKYILTYSQTLNELGLSVSKQFPRGTLVMSIAANIGDVAILDFEACFPDSMIGMIPGHKTDLNYLYYLMRAMKSIMLRSAVLSTQLNLNYVRIGTNFAAFPPRKEQEAIAEYLDAKEKEVLAVKETLNQQIETLLAYRKSLIHECVTGQRRITEDDVKHLSMTTH